MEGLESCLQEALQDSLSSFSVEHCGVWALIVGEGRDMLFVHHYVQIYESLYVAERRSRVAEGGDGANASRSMELFRSWLGLDSLQTDCEVVNALLGSRSSWALHLAYVALGLQFEFSDFQRECILAIDKPITYSAFVLNKRASGMLFIDELPSIGWIEIALALEVFGGP